MLTPYQTIKISCLAARRDLGACVVQKQRMPVWEAKRQAVQWQLERERSDDRLVVIVRVVLLWMRVVALWMRVVSEEVS